MMFRIEIIDKKEFLQYEKDFTDKTDAIIEYKKIINHIPTRKDFKDCIIQLFEGQDVENLRELVKYRVNF